MQCSQCKYDNLPDAAFCQECGAQLERTCPQCQAGNLPAAKFCRKCGTPLTAAVRSLESGVQRGTESRVQSLESRQDLAERRQLTVMFCDLVGSTPLTEKLDPEDLREVILAYQQTCAEQIRRFEGYLARYVGDGLLVYFGYPHAHEDDAQRAIRAGLGMVAALPDLNTRLQQTVTVLRDFPLQVRIGIHTGLVVVGDMGAGAFEVGETYAQARELCRRVGETPQLFHVLWGLRAFHVVRGEYQTGRELGEQMLRLAQSVQDPLLLLGAHYALGTSLLFLGEFALARIHYLEQGITLYDPQQHSSYAFIYGGQAPGIFCLANGSWVLWLLGYPDQALKRSDEALSLAQGLSHPPSLAFALIGADVLHNFRREGQAAQERAEAAIALANEQGFPFHLTAGFVHRGWALAQQGQAEEGIAQIHEGLTASRAIGTEAYRASYLGTLAEAYRTAGQPEEGLTVVAEAMAVVEKTGERWWEAELYRLKGELMLQKFNVQGSTFNITDPQPPIPNPQVEAEACFLKAIEVARRQQAKSWELRTTMSLARLWQQQGKKEEARQMLAEIYGWFTEGFETKDLQEAKALLDELN